MRKNKDTLEIRLSDPETGEKLFSVRIPVEIQENRTSGKSGTEPQTRKRRSRASVRT